MAVRFAVALSESGLVVLPENVRLRPLPLGASRSVPVVSRGLDAPAIVLVGLAPTPAPTKLDRRLSFLFPFSSAFRAAFSYFWLLASCFSVKARRAALIALMFEELEGGRMARFVVEADRGREGKVDARAILVVGGLVVVECELRLWRAALDVVVVDEGGLARVVLRVCRVVGLFEDNVGVSPAMMGSVVVLVVMGPCAV